MLFSRTPFNTFCMSCTFSNEESKFQVLTRRFLVGFRNDLEIGDFTNKCFFPPIINNGVKQLSDNSEADRSSVLSIFVVSI